MPNAAQEAQEVARQVEAIFKASPDEIRALLDALGQVPLPGHLAVWESEGGSHA